VEAAEKPAQPPSHAKGERRAEKKVVAEKPAPKPAEKPAADRSKPPSDLATPRPEKKQAPAAAPAANKSQAAAEAYQRGNAKLLGGALPEAIAAFSEAVRLNPSDAQSQRGLGMAYAQAGNAGQAVRHFKLYLKTSPNAPDRALIQKRIDQLGGR
jgi:tetratricopeptide (TPR) repeat protein